ncbi:dynamin family protein [Hazenella sp. IB182353]|uniref:dynamin family protein n=1 Tax=Polycladospora coralii TaxID=2771432 RepID=UPI0017460A7E|nr:dynamin family protein [Polycladospora coralii]MBS7530224.1 dynamin family protein [Polycladospora coralii]
MQTINLKWLDRLGYLYQEIEQHGDIENRNKVHDLIQKADRQELLIAFCGHFSAGKSTLLNRLYGEPILPTSPIPTSANVVKIERGENRVVLELSTGEKHLFTGTYSDEELKALCKNGEEILAVHIYREVSHLPERVGLLDTPGIDSVDEAHREATESALHVADCIFYMMDYNHVQSEVNHDYIKRLTERGKKVYVIINQIDKHQENELSFSAYQASIESSFRAWEVPLAGIFYTSMRDETHPNNQFSTLKKKIDSIIQNKSTYMEESIYAEASFLIESHMAYCKHEQQDQLHALEQCIKEMGQPKEELDKKVKQVTEAYTQVEKMSQNIHVNFHQGLDQILQNAYLMPADLRDLAYRYLESLQTGFKVGLFLTKTKTETEKSARLEHFHTRLLEVVTAQLDTHINQYLADFMRKQEIYSDERGNVIYREGVTLEPNLLQEILKAGAGLTGNYVLQYTEDLAQEIKRRYKQKGLHIFSKMYPWIEVKYAEQLTELQLSLDQLKQAQVAYVQLAKYKDDWALMREKLWHYLDGKVQPERKIDIQQLIQEERVIRSSTKIGMKQNIQVPVEKVPVESVTIKDVNPDLQLSGVCDLFVRAEKTVSDLTGFENLVSTMQQKRERIQNQQYTIALFGAFSSGKSSFANALIGERILPVSPNPTTATINQIMPPQAGFSHGDVKVFFKPADMLLEDVRQALQWFDYHIERLEDAFSYIEACMKKKAMSPKQKLVLPFLIAVQKGFHHFVDLLGTSITCTLSNFQEYVANEAKSCFVERVELYYDCPLTRQGIRIVDTPGADSIHARHTDVAFQYIKNADAIFFVTYYNHVFSRADREFLIQLGRVKDTFTLDKMFFILNAVDLAGSSEEQHEVQHYLHEQLLTYGIRRPKLFPLSSLQALAEKEGRAKKDVNSGISQFEQAFMQFVQSELQLVTIQGLSQDYHTFCQKLDHFIHSATQSEETKKAQLIQNQQEQTEIKSRFDRFQTDTELHILQQEIDELIYYVKQRLFYRYQDFFQEIFNPSILKEDEHTMSDKLMSCMKELLVYMGSDLMQELRATSLRLESWMDEKRAIAIKNLQEEGHKINDKLVFSVNEQVKYNSILLAEPFQNHTWRTFKKELSMFKNPKHFFEKNGKEQMREQISKRLEPAIDDYLQAEKDLFITHFRSEWENTFQLMKKRVYHEVNAFYTEMNQFLTDETDITAYHEVRSQLEHILDEIDQFVKEEQLRGEN